MSVSVAAYIVVGGYSVVGGLLSGTHCRKEGALNTMQTLRPLQVALVGFPRTSSSALRLEAALDRQHARVTRLELSEWSALDVETDCVLFNAELASDAAAQLDIWRSCSRALWIAVPPEGDGQPLADESTGMLLWPGLRAAMTRSSRGDLMDEVPLRLGPWILYCSTGELSVDGRTYHLRSDEARFMELLMEHPGQIVTLEEIAQRLGEDGNWPRHRVWAVTCRLRQILERGHTPPRWLRTVRGVGYRLTFPRPSVPSADAGTPPQAEALHR
jgi:DNA-binding winged helix-turn-helix (wHTH) protein